MKWKKEWKKAYRDLKIPRAEDVLPSPAERAAQSHKAKRKFPIRQIAAVAACLALLAGIIPLGITAMRQTEPPVTPGTDVPGTTPVTRPPVTDPPVTQPIIPTDAVPIDPPVIMYATDDQVNIRMQPSTAAARYASLHKGDGVTVTARTEDGWYRIIYRDIYTGYVFGAYLTETAVPSGVTSTPFQPPVTMYATEDVNIRADHSTNATKLGVLPAGTSILVLAETSNGWYCVLYQNGEAYISAQYLTKTPPTPAAG